ncbi:MAG: hypothetical protein K2G36_03250 [Ruminococcus sp.]|nr:hypothetical protein [Ruminococcus sp.]
MFDDYDDIDDSEIFGVEKGDDDMIEAYHTPIYDDFDYEYTEPQHYEEYIFFDNLTRYNSISKLDCNIKTLERMINFLIERFKEKGVDADAVVIDKSKNYRKHNRKTEEDIQNIKELIDKGLNNSDIERITNITRRTIAKYRRRLK